jgi:hypothetical protein
MYNILKRLCRDAGAGQWNHCAGDFIRCPQPGRLWMGCSRRDDIEPCCWAPGGRPAGDRLRRRSLVAAACPERRLWAILVGNRPAASARCAADHRRAGGLGAERQLDGRLGTRLCCRRAAWRGFTTPGATVFSSCGRPAANRLDAAMQSRSADQFYATLSEAYQGRARPSTGCASRQMMRPFRLAARSPEFRAKRTAGASGRSGGERGFARRCGQLIRIVRGRATRKHPAGKWAGAEQTNGDLVLEVRDDGEVLPQDITNASRHGLRACEQVS